MILHVKCHLNDVCAGASNCIWLCDRQNVKIWYPSEGANLIFAMLGTK